MFQVSFFDSDWFKLLNVAAFALTNGYFGNLCTIKAPAAVEMEKKGQVGAFIGISITFGLMLGTLLALCWAPVIEVAPKPLKA
jgi:solute carrier family 29 (equilibrative nucleoside transporter), member 1/2/3